MQAIILAAGMGKRLKGLTKNIAKCMVEVDGQSLISRMLRQLDRKNLSRIIIVVGYKSDILMYYINSLQLKTPIIYIENKIYNQTNNIYSLYLTKDYLIKEDTLLLESDLIFDDAALNIVINNNYPNLVLVAKFKSWMDGTVVTLDNRNKITGMYDKKHFYFEKIDSYYKTVNIYKFSKEFSEKQYMPFLEAYCKVVGKNEYYEQVLKVITLLDHINIRAVCLNDEQWYEIDDIQDLDIAETIFSKGSKKLKKLQKAYGGYWRYPGMLDFCYLVNPFYPPQKLLSEIKNSMETLICNYPSGQEINSLLIGKYWGVNPELVCVGNGAAELIKEIVPHLRGSIGGVLPTFEEYKNRNIYNEYIPFKPDEPDYMYTVEDLMKFYENKGIKNLILINPDNPTGNYIIYKEMQRLIYWCKVRDIRIILDESFVDFSDEGKTLIKEEVIKHYNNLIIIKSISKTYGIPGLRLGIAISSDKDIICHLKKNMSIWNINSLAEFFLQIFEKYEVDYKESLSKIKINRKELFHDLSLINNIYPIKSQANFIMCRIENIDVNKLCELLLTKYNILIKSLNGKDGILMNQYIRIAVKTQSENKYLIKALSDIMEDNVNKI